MEHHVLRNFSAYPEFGVHLCILYITQVVDRLRIFTVYFTLILHKALCEEQL